MYHILSYIHSFCFIHVVAYLVMFDLTLQYKHTMTKIMTSSMPPDAAAINTNDGLSEKKD